MAWSHSITWFFNHSFKNCRCMLLHAYLSFKMLFSRLEREREREWTQGCVKTSTSRQTEFLALQLIWGQKKGQRKFSFFPQEDPSIFRSPFEAVVPMPWGFLQTCSGILTPLDSEFTSSVAWAKSLGIILNLLFHTPHLSS